MPWNNEFGALMIWRHLATLGWRHLATVWRHLATPGRHLATLGDTWRHLATLGDTLATLGPFGDARRSAATRQGTLATLWRHFGDTWRHFGDTLATLGDTCQRFIAGSIRPQLGISIDRLRALPAGSGPEMRQFCKVACATAMLKHARTDPPQLLSYSTAGFSTVHDIPSMYDWLTGQWYWMVSIVVVDRTTVVDVSHRRCANGRAGHRGQRLSSSSS